MSVIVVVGIRPRHRRAGKRYTVHWIRAQVSDRERARWSDTEIAEQIAAVAGYPLSAYVPFLQGEGEGEQ